MERIAVVLGKMEMGGVENVVMDYYRNLDRSRYQFDFFIDQNSRNLPQLEITKLGGRVFTLPSVSSLGKYQRILNNYLARGKYGVMHVHLNTLSGWALKVGKKAGVPIRILHNHTTSSIKEGVRHLAKILLRPFARKYATHFVACSNHAGKWAYGKDFDKGSVQILNNGIDVNRFAFDLQARNQIRNELGFEDCVVIGNVGRLAKQKNQGFLIDLFKSMTDDNDRLRLVIIGDGKLKDKLQIKIDKLGLTDKVKILPPRADIEKYYSAFDCLALPSIYEGLGRVVVEAQASGLNCVCSLNVPKEVAVTDGVSFVSLKDKSAWNITLLSKLTAVTNRTNVAVDLVKYDIVSCAKTLEEYYSRLIESFGERQDDAKLKQVAVTDDESENNRCNYPLISILIPIYNVKDFVKQSVDSVINQSYKNIEILLADDGSTDGSGDICDQYTVDNRVRVFHKKNEGLASTRNFLKDRANGEYVIFVDGDDVVCPYYVENLFNAIVSRRTDLACSGFFKFSEGDVFPPFSLVKNFQTVNKKEYLKKVLLQDMECSAWGKIYTKSLAQSIVYPDGAIYEDVAVMPSILEMVDSVAIATTDDYFYRQNAGSILHKPFTERDLDCVKHMDELREYVIREFPDLTDEMACRYFSAMSNVFLRVNKKTHKKEYLLLWQKIKELRKTVLKVKGARVKNKLGAIISYFGALIFRTAYKLI